MDEGVHVSEDNQSHHRNNPQFYDWWEPYDVVFDPYKEYSVEIDVQTIPRDGQDFKFDVTDKGNLFKLNGLLVPLE